MITIVASYNVTPNQPTPKEPLWLSDSDLVAPLSHVPTIYIYKAKHNNTIIERLRDSLSKILVFYYPVAGRLMLTESGRMEVDCNAKGVTLLEAETTNTLGDYGDFSPSQSTKKLVPTVDYTQPIEEHPLLLVQLTKFHGGEGFAIGFAIFHPLVDGISAINFINKWAKVARGEALGHNEMPFLDRTLLKFPHQPSATRIDIPQWGSTQQHKTDKVTQKKREMSVEVFKLTSSHVEKLKKKANDQSLKEGSRPYTRFEVISAHIWRCYDKAREIGENQPTRVRFSVDIRNKLIPPLPQNYFGNALARAVTHKCCVGDIISSPLIYATQKIREAVYAVTDEYIRSYLSSIFGQGHLDSIEAFFSGQGSPISSPDPNDHVFMMTSWITMPVYDADFGWGKPVHFGLGIEFREHRAVILPSSDGDGVIVSLSFPTVHLQLIKKFFYEDI
uniref:Anthranilate N-benzoyltransferase protein 1 n=2 Tax=Cajanus cajan TaxID=3821 RepID=A0A151R1M5_CAJCA|nr:Anthranilate N-benzoyltransferase protein 1 [Cajanus cajan]